MNPWGWGGPHNWFGAGYGPWSGARGRFFEPGEVRIAILALLSEGPKNGYELMKELRVRSGGSYRMSAGTVYPALQQLEDEGLIAPCPKDGKKLFELTDLGRKELDKEKPVAENIWRRASDRADWAQWMGPEAVVIVKPLSSLMKATFRAVKQSGGHPARTSQIYDILNRACREIEELS